PSAEGSLLDRRDVALVLALMLGGLALRLAWFSGYGLDDDGIFRGNISFAMGGASSGDNISFRITWLALGALSCRILGVTEVRRTPPITPCGARGTGLAYAMGQLLWGRAGAGVSALLVLVFPLDFAWSTMLTTDVVVSFFFGLTMFLVLRAAADSHGPRS